jgi:MFS family permease
MPRLAIATCYAAMTTLAISLNLMPVCLPLLRFGLGSVPLTNEQLGRVAAITFVGVVGGLLCGGPLADRIHARWFTVGGNLLILAGLVLLAASTSYVQVLLAVAVMGFGGGILDMILSPIACALQPERRAQAMNWLHSFYCVGAALTILAATVAFSRSIGWRPLALGLAAAPAVVGALFLFVPLPSIAPVGGRLRVRDLVRERFFLLALAAIFFGGATEMGLAQWLPAYAELELGLPRWVGGASLLAFSVAMAAGRMVIGSLSGRVSILLLMAISGASTGALILVAGLCPLPAVALAASVLAGFTGSSLWPSTLALAADRYALASASMFGVLAAFGNFGGIMMPWCVGVVADHSRIALGIAVSAATPLLMLVVLRALHAERLPAPPATAPAVPVVP